MQEPQELLTILELDSPFIEVGYIITTNKYRAVKMLKKQLMY